LSASGSHPRIHLTRESKSNPQQPPVFCMLLRNRLTSGFIRGIRQPGLERIVEIDCAARDELGYETNLTLRLECMGQHSNLILTDGSGKILDSVKHVTERMSRVREVLPGIPYEYPPAQEKSDPRSCTAEDFQRILGETTQKTAASVLVTALQGLSPQSARALCARAGLEADMPLSRLAEEEKRSLAQALVRFYGNLDALSGAVLIREPGADSALDFLPFPHMGYPQDWQEPFATLSEAMDAFYKDRDRAERKGQHTARLRQVLKHNRERCEKKLSIQEKILEDLPQTETYKLRAELLTAYAHLVPKGAKEAVLPNYYEENTEVSVPLDPSKNAHANAQICYKKYRKAHTAAAMAQEQIEKIREEMNYLEDLEASVELCSDERSLEEIVREMTEAGYLREPGGKKVRKQNVSAPMKFMAPDGSQVLVGRNHAQNDQLTMRTAGPRDIWLHAQGIPGSHVVLLTGGGEPSREALEFAAALAAYFSRARGSASVPVDYTQRKNVRKPAGARPGFVLYQPFRTVFVRPDEARLKELGVNAER